MLETGDGDAIAMNCSGGIVEMRLIGCFELSVLRMKGEVKYRVNQRGSELSEEVNGTDAITKVKGGMDATQVNKDLRMQSDWQRTGTMYNVQCTRE